MADQSEEDLFSFASFKKSPMLEQMISGMPKDGKFQPAEHELWDTQLAGKLVRWHLVS